MGVNFSRRNFIRGEFFQGEISLRGIFRGENFSGSGEIFPGGNLFTREFSA